MNIPQDLRYTKEHEWLLLEDGVVVIGVTDFAQTELGDIVYVELPAVGSSLKMLEPFDFDVRYAVNGAEGVEM